MERNAEQIKKALECCKRPKLTKCDGCPREQEDGHCMYRLNEDALSLIKSQEQRIKQLTEEIESLKQAMEHEHASFMETFGEYGEKCERLTEENERILTALANYDRQTDVRIAENYYTVEAYEELREENERLHTSYTELTRKCESLDEENERVKLEYAGFEAGAKHAVLFVKADTVRKMHFEIKERCIKGGVYPAFVASTIEQIVKEMESANG